MRLLATAAACLLLAAVATPAASAATSLADIEDEVMCTICGTTLQLSSSPQAERERAFINELIAKGKSKEQVKAALVEEYGPEVLAVPSDEGFDLVGGWILPAAGVVVGAALVIGAAWRWRRSRREEEESEPPADALPDADEERLRKDLDLYS
jgi:cytochrome c-type biogenesis protein CcmH